MYLSAIMAISALGFLVGQTSADSSWTCQELETTTDPFYRMFPAFVAKAFPNDEASHFIPNLSGHCFGAMDILTEFSYLDEDQTQLHAEITFQLKTKKEALCTEHLQISTAFSDHYDFYMRHGSKTVSIDFRNLEEVIDIHTDGLKFFTYCANQFDLLSSSIETLFLWLGGSGYTSNHIPVFGSRPTDYQVDGNSAYLSSFAGLWLEERIIDQVFFDYNLMETGDLLVGRRFTGLAAQQMLFSGSYASHVAMVVREVDGLYVIECREDWTTDKRTGVMKTKLDDWVPAAYQAGYEVVWLPLDRNGLNYLNSNRDSLLDWFSTVEGNEYSPVKDFLASFDHPYQGLPAPFNTESLPMYMRIWYKHKNKIGYTHFWNEFIEAMGFRFIEMKKDEMRLSKWQLPSTFDEAVKFAAIDLNMSLQELLAIPEQDEWRYETNSRKQTFTPASFIIEALKELRVLDRFRINASEFTIKDVYELNIFDTQYEIPDQCLEADHTLPGYCQLFGKYRVYLDEYSTLDPYDNMNETCPNRFENEWRTPEC